MAQGKLDAQHAVEFDALYQTVQQKCDAIKLEAAHKKDLLASCLQLLSLFSWRPHLNSAITPPAQPKHVVRFECEPNLLSRILTILGSITREYEYAKKLLDGEGYRCILDCATVSSAASRAQISAVATGIIRQMFDEPSLLTEAMTRQIKLSFEHFRQLFTAKKPATTPFNGLNESLAADSVAFTQLFDPYMPLANFLASFKTLAARNQDSFLRAVKNTCLVVADAQQPVQLLVSSRELLNKLPAKWESQDPRTIQWMAYSDADTARIEAGYQAFVDRFIAAKLQNFHKQPAATLTVHFDGQTFTIDVREYRQKNGSGGSRKIRRRRLNLDEKRKLALLKAKELKEKELKERKEQLEQEQRQSKVLLEQLEQEQRQSREQLEQLEQEQRQLEEQKEQPQQSAQNEASDDAVPVPAKETHTEPVAIAEEPATATSTVEEKADDEDDDADGNDEYGDVAIRDKDPDKAPASFSDSASLQPPGKGPAALKASKSLRGGSSSPSSKAMSKYLICPPSVEEPASDAQVLSSFEAPLNVLMSIIVRTTGEIKDYCAKK